MALWFTLSGALRFADRAVYLTAGTLFGALQQLLHLTVVLLVLVGLLVDARAWHGA